MLIFQCKQKLEKILKKLLKKQKLFKIHIKMDETNQMEEKFKIILKGFHNPNYKITNDVYFEMLITHLSGKDHSCLLNPTFVHEWIDETLNILTNDFTKLNEKIITFMLKLVAMLTENEWLVAEVRDRKLADRIQTLVETNILQMTASEKLAYVRLVAALSGNGLGLGWIKRQKAWSILISFCTESETVYVVRETIAIIYELLYKFSVKKNDDELCLKMLKEIFQPINDNVFDDSKPSVKVNDLNLLNKIKPRLVLIDFILQKTLESECKTKIAYYCEHNFNLERNLWKLADMTHNEEFLTIILKTMTSINYAKLVFEKWINGPIPSADFNQFGVNFFNHMNFIVIRRNCSNILIISEYNYMLWKKLGARAPAEIIIENKSIEFENQLILFHILPVLFILRGEKDEILDTYFMKLFEISCEFTLRIVYAFREVIFGCPENVCDLAMKSINSILSMQHILNRNHAVLVFQAMMYALKEFTIESKDDGILSNVKPTSQLLLQSPNVLRSILICLHSLIKTYRITWKDSIETICILSLVLDLLKDPNLTDRVAVQSIKLVQLSIEHYLSPNLALLMNNFNESGMQHLGPMLVKRLHDISWEVRDSTIELITSIVEISESKFPAFQQYILSSGVCPIIFSMAKNDEEPYIRASAYKCLTKMTVINLLWEQSLSQYEIMTHLLSSIKEEYEGIVRMELVGLICKIFDHRKIDPNELDKVYVTMANCAVNDLHWEVKLKSLNFWKFLICKQFSNQGMIDGTFPTVTFSKEHKKIVTLTEKEILLRIKKILLELSNRGCLNILHECLHDDCDLEVVKKSVHIVKKLLDCLNKYDYIKSLETEINEENDATNLNVSKTIVHMEINDETGEMIDNDQVIESIVGANDLSLLANSYKNKEIVNNRIDDQDISLAEENNKNSSKLFNQIKPNDFINFIKKTDLDALIKSKSDWISNTESFESLLDDMVYSIKTFDINDADCY